MKKFWLLLLGIFLCIYQVDVRADNNYTYSTLKVVESLNIHAWQGHGVVYPLVDIKCTDGTKWSYIGTVENIEVLRLWKKGDRLSLYTDNLNSAYHISNRYKMSFRNIDCYFERNIEVLFIAYTKSVLPTIVHKRIVDNYEYITLSDGSEWKTGYIGLLWWTTPLSHEWQVGQSILVTASSSHGYVYGYALTNVSQSPKECIFSATCTKQAVQDRKAALQK